MQPPTTSIPDPRQSKATISANAEERAWVGRIDGEIEVAEPSAQVPPRALDDEDLWSLDSLSPLP